MAKHRYKAKDGAWINNKQAQRIGEVIESIESDGLQVTPKNFLVRAKKKNSPVHDLFDWNLKKSAEEHWLEVSRSLIRSVCVVTVVTVKPKTEFHSVMIGQAKEPQQRFYVRRDVILKKNVLLNQKSADLYRRALTVVSGVRDLGLDSEESWRRIITAIEVNAPPGWNPSKAEEA